MTDLLAFLQAEKTGSRKQRECRDQSNYSGIIAIASTSSSMPVDSPA